MLPDVEQARTKAGRKLDAGYDAPDYVMHWDPNGKPCTLGRWAELYERRGDGDASWWRLGRTFLGADERVEISTVWHGLDLGLISYRRDTSPRIFGTLIRGGRLDQHELTWISRAQALRGHAFLVRCAMNDATTFPVPVKVAHSRRYSR